MGQKRSTFAGSIRGLLARFTAKRGTGACRSRTAPWALGLSGLVLGGVLAPACTAGDHEPALASRAIGVTGSIPIKVAVPVPSVPFSITNAPIQLGVPLPKGALPASSSNRVVLRNPSGGVVPAQSSPLTTWENPSEGPASIKYLKLMFSASPVQSGTYTLEYDVNPIPAAPPSPVTVTNVSGGLMVDTGAIRFMVKQANPTLLDKVWMDVNGNGVVEETEQIVDPLASKGLYLVDDYGETYRASFDPAATLVVEESGPLQATLRAEGSYQRATGQQLNKWIVRLKAYAGQPFVRIYHTYIVTKPTGDDPAGDPNPQGDARFRDIGIELPLIQDGPRTVVFPPGRQWLDPNDPLQVPPNNLPDPEIVYDSNFITFNESQLAPAGSVFLHQDTYKRFRVWRDAVMTDHDNTQNGHWIRTQSSQRAVTASMRWSWQNHPVGFEWLPADKLRVHLWTQRDTQLLDFRPKPYLESRGRWQTFANQACAVQFEIRPGVPELPCAVPGTVNWNGLGVSKTHEILLDFHRTAATAQATQRAYLLQRPAYAYADPQAARATLAAGYVHPYDPDRFSGLEIAISKVMDRYRLEQMKGIPGYGDLYGSFDFGDTPHTGSAHRFWSHHFFTEPSIWWQLFRRSGDRRYLDFGEANARHHMDIDVVHAGGVECIVGLPNTCTAASGKLVTPGGYNDDNTGLFHWGGVAGIEGTQHVIPHLVSYYNLTGYERARDVALLIGKMYVENFSGHQPDAGGARQTGTSLWNLTELYSLMWNQPGLSTPAQNIKVLADRYAAELMTSTGPVGEPADQGPVYTINKILYPADHHAPYNLLGAEAYHRLTGSPAIANWIIQEADFLRAVRPRHNCLHDNNNCWVGPVFAYRQTPPVDGINYLKTPKFFADVQAKWTDLELPGTPNHRTWWLMNAPLLMDALVAAGGGDPANVPAVGPPVSTVGEIRLLDQNDSTFELTVQLQHAHASDAFVHHAGGTTDAPCCFAPITAAADYDLVLYRPDGTEAVRRPAPSSTAQSDWYQGGGWLENIRVDSDGQTGVYRLVVDPPGRVNAPSTRWRDASAYCEPWDSNSETSCTSGPAPKPLFSQFLVRNTLNKAMYEVGLPEGMSPDHRYPFTRRFHFYVPPGTTTFHLRWLKPNATAAFKLIFYPPGGAQMEHDLGVFGYPSEEPPHDFFRRATVTVPAGTAGQWWQVDLPGWGTFRTFELVGVPNFFASSPTEAFDINTPPGTASALVAVGDAGQVSRSTNQGSNWTDVSPGTADMWSIAHGAGHYVAVGFGGAIWRSADGVQWTFPSAGGGGHLYSVRYCHNNFFAGGAGGALLRSTDGASWTNITPGAGYPLATVDIACGTGQGITAVGYSGKIIASADAGATWTSQTPAGFTTYLSAVAIAGGTRIAVGDSGKILRSTNGGAWSVTTWSPPAGFSGIAYGGGKWVIGGQYGTLLVSTNDGASWTTAPAVDGQVGDIEYLPTSGRFLAVGSHGKAWHATDPSGTWTQVIVDPGQSHLSGVAVPQ
jgi:photosystem II stability/assembly factor-like uncharacterized protein